MSASSTIIEEIETLRKAGLASVAMFFYDFGEDQRRTYVDRYHRCYPSFATGPIPTTKSFDFQFNTPAWCTEPSNDGIVICLKDLLNLPGQALIFRVLIVDALDECPNTLALSSPREKVLVILEDFLNSQLPSLRICVTSRPEVGIKPEGCPCTLIFLFYFVILLYERGHTEHSEVGREHE